MKYYLWKNEQQQGPYEDFEILKMLNENVISEDTLACAEGDAETKWIKVSGITSISWSLKQRKSNTQSPKYIPSKIGSYATSFGAIFMLIGVIATFFIAISGNIAASLSILLSSIAVYIFFTALGEIIRILLLILIELKNHPRQ
jgi:hypothetical protein